MSVFILRPADPEKARARMAAAWHSACRHLELDKPVRVTVDEFRPQRTNEQNEKLQAMCGDVAAQVEWHGQHLSKDDWRHMFVASYRKGQRAVPGIDGGFVVLGASSRDLRVAECADVIELIYAFGAEHDVRWSDLMRRDG